MIIVITISTFICIALGVMCVYWLVSREASVVDARLSAMDPTVGILVNDSMGSLVERVAAPISQLVPSSTAEVNKLQKQLMQAGHRSPEAPTIFRAIQIVGFVAFPCVVVLACFFLQRPLSSFLIWSFLAAASGFYLPRYVLRRQIRNRQQRISWGLADALDLLVVTVEAGLGLNAAMVRVGEELKNVHPDIHQEFEMVNLEIRVGRSREESLRNLAERTGVDDLRSFVAIMIQADKFGSSIGRAVRIFADSLRTKRRQRAQQASQKAALKLLFPLTIFLFPTIIMVILGPAFLNLIDAFSK